MQELLTTVETCLKALVFFFLFFHLLHISQGLGRALLPCYTYCLQATAEASVKNLVFFFPTCFISHELGRAPLSCCTLQRHAGLHFMTKSILIIWNLKREKGQTNPQFSNYFLLSFYTPERERNCWRCVLLHQVCFRIIWVATLCLYESLFWSMESLWSHKVGRSFYVIVESIESCLAQVKDELESFSEFKETLKIFSVYYIINFNYFHYNLIFVIFMINFH